LQPPTSKLQRTFNIVIPIAQWRERNLAHPLWMTLIKLRAQNCDWEISAPPSRDPFGRDDSQAWMLMLEAFLEVGA